jgi:hypothetical protein
MNVHFVRQCLALGFSTLLLLVVSSGAAAQTSRKRTPAKTTARTTATPQPTARYAYEHGYLAGYDDGYAQGRAGFNENQPRDFNNNQAYRAADRGYTDRLGTRIEYQEGYRVGFELGSSDGYYGRPSTRTIPTNLSRVVVGRINAADIVSNDPATTRPRTEEPRYTPSPSTTTDRRPSEPARTSDRTRTTNSRTPLVIPDGVQMKIRLTDQINTKTNREGDKFTAIVLDPSEYADAQVVGHIAKLNKAGKATGKTELVLVFDSIQMRNGNSGRFAAQVERIYESESVRSVDEEGNVESGSRTKETVTRTAGGAALGAIIGGIAGGGKGAAIGAAIGAGLGVGSVYIDGGKDLILEPGTEMLIRTAAPARTRN